MLGELRALLQAQPSKSYCGLQRVSYRLFQIVLKKFTVSASEAKNLFVRTSRNQSNIYGGVNSLSSNTLISNLNGQKRRFRGRSPLPQFRRIG